MSDCCGHGICNLGAGAKLCDGIIIMVVVWFFAVMILAVHVLFGCL